MTLGNSDSGCGRMDRDRYNSHGDWCEIGWAKVNLALHVRACLSSGYHRLETIFAFVDDGDRLSVEAAEDISLTIIGPYAAQLRGEHSTHAQRAEAQGADDRKGRKGGRGTTGAGDNLVHQAARGLQRLAGVTQGARITLDKRLPIAAGLGGGSADAAATLRLLPRFWGLGPDWTCAAADVADAREARAMGGSRETPTAPRQALVHLAQQLGADVPACLYARTLRGDGVGDRLTMIDDLRWQHSWQDSWAHSPILLVHPNPNRRDFFCPTARIFADWDGVDRGPLDMSDWRMSRNDLTDSACAQVPAIRDLLALLDAQPDAHFVRMSGSGSTCFALFAHPQARDAAQVAILQQLPNVWTLAGYLR